MRVERLERAASQKQGRGGEGTICVGARLQGTMAGAVVAQTSSTQGAEQERV
jgi:hypothetical protein